MPSLQAFNFRQWIDANRALLKPPVGNKRVFQDGDFIIMVVGGPNARKDYHVDPGQEFFYQLEGNMVLKTMQDGRPVDVPIREGEILLIPPGCTRSSSSSPTSRSSSHRCSSASLPTARRAPAATAAPCSSAEAPRSREGQHPSRRARAPHRLRARR